MKFLGDLDTSNLLLLDVKYATMKNENNKKEDYLMLLLKNVVTGEKMVYNIKEPEMEVWFMKEEFRNYTHNLTHTDIDKTYTKKFKYKNLIFDIAKEAGPQYQNYVKQCFEQRKYKSAKNVHRYPYVFGSDLDIENYYRIMWRIHYHNENIKIENTTLMIDIEVDGIEFAGIPLEGEVPINAISITDKEDKECHLFLLKNSVRPNPQIQVFEDNIDSFKDLCHKTFDEKFGRHEYNVYMFEDEDVMLKCALKFIKDKDKDFNSVWNLGFDFLYIVHRLENLGIDPVEHLTSEKFAVREYYYFSDKKAGQIIEKRDYIKTSTTSIYVDAMLVYGKLRKGRGVLPSLRLDFIAEREIDEQKIDYSDIATIKTLAYVNYELFSLYAIKDTLLMEGIENRTNDITNYLIRAIENASSYKELFSPTKFLKNRYTLELLRVGKVPGNNINIDYDASYDDKTDDDEILFDGAVVGDSKLNAHVGIDIYGVPSMFVFRNVVDMDRFVPCTSNCTLQLL